TPPGELKSPADSAPDSLRGPTTNPVPNVFPGSPSTPGPDTALPSFEPRPSNSSPPSGTETAPERAMPAPALPLPTEPETAPTTPSLPDRSESEPAKKLPVAPDGWAP